MSDAAHPNQLSLGLDERTGLALPLHLEPARARPVSEPFDSPDYLFETRWNGIRAMAAIAAGQVRLHSRRQGDLSARFPELAGMAQCAADQPLLLDGEIVIVDDRGRPDFEAPQWRLRLLDDELIRAEAQRLPACYLASDVLFRGRRWLLSEPLQRRKRQLDDALHQAECLYLAESFENEGRALFQASVESELEGILAKPKYSPYTPGSFSAGWLAVGREREELVVGGYSMQIAGGSRSIELLLGGYDAAGRLTFVAAVRPPDDEPLRGELFAVLNALQVDQPPFGEPPPFIACWVRPELVVSVRFSDRSGGNPGDAVFERVRLDVSPADCLLPVDAPLPLQVPNRDHRPQLTMLTTLALPLGEAATEAPSRPDLRIVDEPAS